MWAGVDVGGRRKGFHLAVVDATGRIAGATCRKTPTDAAAWLRAFAPELVAVDSPRSLAPAGTRSRHCERSLVRAGVCGIRYTPDDATVRARASGYYEWIVHGLELYGAIAAAGLEAVECFPTASWSRLAGARGGATRARWTQLALARLDLSGVPSRLNQDERDALAAAVTAREHARAATESFGEIVVPRAADGC